MTNLHYDVHPGKGKPLLMVHGFLSSRAQWHPNLDALAEICTPITVELYGHGRSPSPSDPAAYSPEGYLAEFESIREAVGVNDWFLCGYSLGAGLTIRYALQYPQHTIAHIFTNSMSAFSPRPEQRPAERIISHYQSGGLAMIEKIPVHPRYAKRLPEDIKAKLVADAHLLDPVGVARGIAYTNSVVSVRDQLQQNTRPALLICGKEEKRFHDLRDFVEANMPRTTLVDLPAGHAVNVECADQFNQATINFIQQYS